MNHLLGLFIIYIIVIIIIPILLLNYAPFSVFITWFANVDIVSNILSINYPDYFKHVYNINPGTLGEYISYNAISLIALSGIFIHGLRTHKESKLKTLLTMIIMSIITWTLPTQAIPFINNNVDSYIEKNFVSENEKSFKNKKLLITIAISLMFVFLEWFVIHYILELLELDFKLPKMIDIFKL